MSGIIYLCGGDSEECERHGKFIYFCNQCHTEWQEKNPNQTKAISEYAQGKGNLATIKAAKKADEDLRESTAVQQEEE